MLDKCTAHPDLVSPLHSLSSKRKKADEKKVFLLFHISNFNSYVKTRPEGSLTLPSILSPAL